MKKLREAAEKFKQNRTAANLESVPREAALLQAENPAQSSEVVTLLKKLLPVSTPPSQSDSTTKS
jgi:hypothetical protein